MNKFLVKDNHSGKIHEYGTNQHDALIISGNGGCVTYYNLQNGDGSLEDGTGGYSLVAEDGEIPSESDAPEALYDSCYANIGGFYSEHDFEALQIYKDKIKALKEYLEERAKQCMEWNKMYNDCEVEAQAYETQLVLRKMENLRLIDEWHI